MDDAVDMPLEQKLALRPPAEHFLEGFGRQIALSVEQLRQAGTTVVPTPDRTGTERIAAYDTVADGFDHTVIWTDPDNVEPLGLADLEADTTTPLGQLETVFNRAGGTLLARATMRIPTDLTLFDRHADSTIDQSGTSGPALSWAELDAADADDRDLIRRFTAQIDPDEVEEADLEDVDNLSHCLIRVLVDDKGDIAAYAAGIVWDWDGGLVDVGVLVGPAHRRRGLGRYVVARVCAEVVNSGRLPLYRHDRANLGSGRLADGLGFESVVDLTVHTFSAGNI